MAIPMAGNDHANAATLEFTNNKDEITDVDVPNTNPADRKPATVFDLILNTHR
jgi:hypothetical protein